MWSLQSTGLTESNKDAQKDIIITNLKCHERKRAYNDEYDPVGTQEGSNTELRWNSYHGRSGETSLGKSRACAKTLQREGASLSSQLHK